MSRDHFNLFIFILQTCRPLKSWKCFFIVKYNKVQIDLNETKVQVWLYWEWKYNILFKIPEASGT